MRARSAAECVPSAKEHNPHAIRHLHQSPRLSQLSLRPPLVAELREFPSKMCGQLRLNAPTSHSVPEAKTQAHPPNHEFGGSRLAARREALTPLAKHSQFPRPQRSIEDGAVPCANGITGANAPAI